MVRSRSYSTSFSDHKAVILQLDFVKSFCSYPFKFNPTWLKEDVFNELVLESWGRLYVEALFHLNPMQSLIFKLNKLHPLVIYWKKDMKKENDKSLCEVEGSIQALEEVVDDQFFSEVRKKSL